METLLQILICFSPVLLMASIVISYIALLVICDYIKKRRQILRDRKEEEDSMGLFGGIK